MDIQRNSSPQHLHAISLFWDTGWSWLCWTPDMQHHCGVPAVPPLAQVAWSVQSEQPKILHSRLAAVGKWLQPRLAVAIWSIVGEHLCLGSMRSQYCILGKTDDKKRQALSGPCSQCWNSNMLLLCCRYWIIFLAAYLQAHWNRAAEPWRRMRRCQFNYNSPSL